MAGQGLPEAESLVDELLALAVPFEEVNRLLAVRERLAQDGELQAVFDEAVAEQTAAIGTLGLRSGLPVVWPERVDPAEGSYLTVLLFVALAPVTRAWHRERGIPDEVSRQTLTDLGRQLAVSRRRGVDGLRTGSWLTLHFRGELYQLGRLQFQRRRLAGERAAEVAAAGLGPWSLELHIPDFHGPLTPESCDRSLLRARDFFARHFPGEPYQSACVFSWLLDRQLADYLPPGSNILRFQQRFAPLGLPGEPEDNDPLRFVFGDSDRPLDSLPRDTAVQRAVVDHLRTGGHWYAPGGWFALDTDHG